MLSNSFKDLDATVADCPAGQSDIGLTGSLDRWLSRGTGPGAVSGQSDGTSCERTLVENEHLFIEGMPQTHVYLVMSGVIGLYKVTADGKRQICHFLYPGSVAGFNTSGRFATSAEALSPVRVRCIQHGVIDRLMREQPAFGLSLLKQTTEELNGTWDRMLSLGRQSALEKVAGFLLGIARRNARHGHDPTELQIPMKRSDIADFLGLTIETVSRNVSRLKSAGVIESLSHSRIRVVDSERLRTLAERD